MERAHLLCSDVVGWINECTRDQDDIEVEGLYRSVRVLELLARDLEAATEFMRSQIEAARKE